MPASMQFAPYEPPEGAPEVFLHSRLVEKVRIKSQQKYVLVRILVISKVRRI